MTFIRRVKNNDNVYVYEVQTYREKGTNKVKQNTTYLGKEIIENGKAIILPPKRKMKHLREVLDYGQAMALFKLADDFGLPDIIEDCIGQSTRINDVGLKITIMAINSIISEMTIQSIGHWYSRNSLKKRLSITPDDFTPKKVRTLLEFIGSKTPDVIGLIEEGIAKRIMELNKDDLDMVVYDLTALRYYGENNNLAQYGHVYRTTGEKQINMVMAVTMKHKLPVHHKILPGKIVSVSTIHSFLKELDMFGITNAVLVLDRGFYSKRNVNEMLNAKNDVIGALSSSLAITKKALTNSIDIENSRYRIKYPDQIMFAKEFNIDGIRIIVYHDSKKRSRQLETFYEQLNEVENKLFELKDKTFEQKQELLDELKGVCGIYAKYFSIKHVYSDTWRFRFKLKHKSVQRFTNRLGKTVLFTSTSLDVVDILKTYREKDVIEKAFQLMKKHGLAKVNSNLEESTKARVLLSYLGYLLLNLLRMKLDDKISLEKALTHLDEVREVVYKDESMEISELTKQQKEVLKKLEMM